MKVSNQQRELLIQNVRQQFNDALELKQKFIEGAYTDILVSMAEAIATAIQQGGKLMLCGNGGSAADAQHLACELLVRLRSHTNRESIPAISLALDTSTLTACANDYGFEFIYERMVQGLGKSGDVLLGLTTSGHSNNVIRAFQAARTKNIQTFGFLGGKGGQAVAECDNALIVPSFDTNRVQEIHIIAGHILMDLIEALLLENKSIKRNEGYLQPTS